MKKSEFKAIVKECVRECIREIMQEQINPVGLHEMFGNHAPQPVKQQRQQQSLGLINPMDDDGMRMRQELINQRQMMQSQLQRQSMQGNVMQRELAPFADLAGLGGQQHDEKNYARRLSTGEGYMNPLDRIKQAASIQPPVRFNPQLDVPVAGGAPRHAQSQQRQMNNDVGYARHDMMGQPDINLMKPPSPEVLREIYADTMRSESFAEQLSAELQPPPADRFAAAVASANPDELFNGSQNWAALAFQ